MFTISQDRAGVIEFALIVGKFALFGPLIGGAPYVWTVFAIPFAYLLGIVPAITAGALFACWLRAGPQPGNLHSAIFGALFGGFGCVSYVVGANAVSENARDVSALLEATQGLFASKGAFEWFLLPHGIFAGAVLGGMLASDAQPKAVDSAAVKTRHPSVPIELWEKS